MLIYIAASRIPSRDANSVHVMRMCDAFSSLTNTILISPNVKDNFDKDFYGVRNSFEIYNFQNKLFEIKKMIKLIRSHPNALVYGRYIYYLFIVSLFRKVSLELHCPISKLSKKNRFLLKMMLILNRVQLIVVISEPLKKIIDEELCSSIMTFVFHDGAVVNPFPVVYSGAVARVGYVGHLYPGRGVPLIIELAKRLPDIEFELVGGNEDDINIWKETTNLPNLRFVGFLAPSDVQARLVQYDALLAPYEDKVSIARKGDSSVYMSPLKIFEYMASGVPFICSDHPVIRAIVEEGGGIAVPYDDVDAWVESIRYFDNPQARQHAGSKGKRLIASAYSWSSRASNILKRLRDV